MNNSALKIKNKSVNICVGHNETTNEARMKMGKEVLSVSSGKTRDDPSMWPMRAFVTVDDYEL